LKLQACRRKGRTPLRLASRSFPSVPVPLAFATLLALAGLVLLAGCEEPDMPRDQPVHANVIFIVVDTLRADHVGAYGYERDTTPHIDALARESLLFERAYAAAPWTKPSVASMMTGLHAGTHTAIRMESKLPGEAVTLAERFVLSGYATGGVVSHHILGKAFGFSQGFIEYDESEARGHMHLSTKPVTRKAMAMLDRFLSDAPERPFFLFVHYFDPHFVYLRHEGYGFAGARPERIKWKKGIKGLRNLAPPPSEEETRYLRDSYDEEIRFTDEGIGELLDGLRERGLYDDTIVVLTADHGEEFFERGWLGHSVSLYDELVHVPLIIRDPKTSGVDRATDQPVSLVSLAPTLLDLCEIEYEPDSFQSSSLVRLVWGIAESASRLLAYTEMNDRTDPSETVDVAEQNPNIVEALMAPLRHTQSITHSNPLGSQNKPLSRKDRRMLEALGYLD